jgi:hypothetical protein
VIVIGLVAFAVWQGLAAATGFRWASGRDRTQRRIAAGATAFGVLVVALIGVQLLVTGSSGSSSSSSQQTTAGLLALPGGRLIVGVVALVVLVIAGGTAWTGIRGDFTETWTGRACRSACVGPPTGSGSPATRCAPSRSR